MPASALFVAGGLSMYLGAALAVDLFTQLSPASVGWLRIMGAAVVLVGGAGRGGSRGVAARFCWRARSASLPV